MHVRKASGGGLLGALMILLAFSTVSVFRNAQVRVPRGWCRGRCRKGELLPRSKQLPNFMYMKFQQHWIAGRGCLDSRKVATDGGCGPGT